LPPAPARLIALPACCLTAEIQLLSQINLMISDEQTILCAAYECRCALRFARCVQAEIAWKN